MAPPSLSDLLKLAQKLGLAPEIQQSISRIWKLSGADKTTLTAILIHAKTAKERDEKARSTALHQQLQKFEKNLTFFVRNHTGAIRKAREKDSQHQESHILQSLEQSFQEI